MTTTRTSDRPVQVPLWRALLGCERPMTIGELAAATSIGTKQIDLRLNLWVAAGLLQKVPGRRTSPGTFILAPTAERTPTPPMIDRLGRSLPKPRAAYERIWSAIRVCKAFDVAELSMAASVERRSLMAYLGALRRTGYITITQRGHRFTGSTRYRLVRNTGRIAPQETARGRGSERVRIVVDRNTGEEHVIPPSRAASIDGGEG